MIAWIQRTLTSSTTGNPSTKRPVFLLASVALIVSLLGLFLRHVAGLEESLRG